MSWTKDKTRDGLTEGDLQAIEEWLDSSGRTGWSNYQSDLERATQALVDEIRRLREKILE